jgi:hypothetical protein
MRYTKDNFTITDDNSLLDKEFVIKALHGTPWAEKRPREIIEKSIQNSTVIGVKSGQRTTKTKVIKA